MSDTIETHQNNKKQSPGEPSQWMALRHMDIASYVTVVIGYLLSILGAKNLTLFNFGVITILNLLYVFLLYRYALAPEARLSSRPVVLVILSVLVFLNGVLTGWGLRFDFLLYFAMVASYFTVLSPRNAIIATILLYLLSGLTFAIIENWKDLPLDWLSLLAGFAFVGAFSLSNRLLLQERERSELLFHQLDSSNRELEEAHKQLQQYAREVEELTIARERTRVAREIHDTLGHYLTIITIQLETISKLQERDPVRARVEIDEARRVAAQCMQEVRNAVAALRPSGLASLDLKQALVQLASEFRGVVPDTELTLDLETALPAHSAELQLTLYRVAQEALTNVRKHTRATRVLVRLRYEHEMLELLVRDNGAGIPTGQLSALSPSGFGLTGLRERIELLGGQIMYGSVEPTGFRVLVRIHIPQKQVRAEEIKHAIMVEEEIME